MSASWLSRLTNTHGHRLRLYFTIQGIPNVFQEDEEDVPAVLEDEARPRTKLVQKIHPATTKLVMAERRVEGGTLTIELMDDEAGTLTALFAPRAYRSTYVRADCDDNAATVHVKSEDEFVDEPGAVYVDGETIAYESRDADSLFDCERGAYGSTATGHFGSSEQGAAVYRAPSSWKGRRVYLHSYFLNDDGTTTAALERVEGTFRIEKAPRQDDDGQWVITCTELGNEIYKKKIGRGLREMEIEPTHTHDSPSPDDDERVLSVGLAVKQFAMGDATTQVVLKSDEGNFACVALIGVDETDAEITINPQASLVDPVAAPWHFTTAVRHIAILEDTWASIALQVLISKLGDFGGGGFDRLPGTEPETFAGPSFQMGAGIPETEIDIASFQAAGDLIKGRYVIDSEHTVADFLFEFCLATNSVPYFTRGGLLAARPISSQSNDTAMSVNATHLHEGSRAVVEYDEEDIAPRADIECNYDVLTQEYCARINTYDETLAKKYPGDEKTLLLRSKSIIVEEYPLGKNRVPGGIQEVRPSIGVARPLVAVETDMRVIQVTSGRGRARVSGRWHLDLLQLEIGDLVNLAISAPNLEGADSISQLARLVEIGPDFDDNAVDATFELIDQVFVFAPACLIESVDGAVLTLKTGTLEAYEPSTPGQMFGDNFAVQVWDISAGTYVQRRVLSHTDTTVTLDSAPGFGIEDGVDLLRMDAQTLPSDGINQDAFRDTDFAYQMHRQENSLITIDGDQVAPTISRWR